jgi:hypothetical protein
MRLGKDGNPKVDSRPVVMEPVESSNIEAIGHHETSSLLFVRFKGGRTYMYDRFRSDKHRALMSADSVGAHFAKHIKPKHIGRPL